VNIPSEPDLQVQAQQVAESASLRRSDGVVETRKISEIKKGVRHRKAMGDISSLMASIETIGLLHPVVINKDNELIAGARRLMAFKLLRREEIPVTVVDIDSPEIVLGENAENEQRKNFTVTERIAIGKEVERVLGERRGRRNQNVQEIAQLPKGKKTRDEAAEKSGFGNPETYRQAKAVVTAAEAEPEKFGALAEQMDATGKVEPAHKPLKASRRSAAVEAAADKAERRSRSAQKPQPPKSTAQKALAEFKVAVVSWFSKMDDDAKREAVAYVIAYSKAVEEA
jgi:ParB-like chromosome segregation protein Spo0J